MKNTQETYQILSTTNYSQFKPLKGNRRVVQGHLKNIIISIQENNLLSVQPILVNEKYEIVDGQHRLEAARRMNIEIYYVVVPATGIREVQLLNATHANWTMNDYMDSYAELGYEEYVSLQIFCRKHNITVANALVLTSNQRQLMGRVNRFKRGLFEVQDAEQAEIAAELGRQIFLKCDDSVRSDRQFWFAILRIIDNKDVDRDRLIESLSSLPEKINKQISTNRYLLKFEEAYNSGRKIITRFY